MGSEMCIRDRDNTSRKDEKNISRIENVVHKYEKHAGSFKEKNEEEWQWWRSSHRNECHRTTGLGKVQFPTTTNMDTVDARNVVSFNASTKGIVNEDPKSGAASSETSTNDLPASQPSSSNDRIG